MLRKPSEMGRPDPQPQPLVEPSQSASSGSSSSGGIGQQLISFAVIVAVALLLWDRFGGSIDWGSDRGDDQHHEQKQDDKREGDKKQDSKLVAKPGVLFLIHDKPTATVERIELVNEVRAMRAAVSGLEYREFDDDKDDSAEVANIKKFAKEKGVDPPFVAFKPAGKSLQSAISWPKDKAALMEVFK